MAYESTQWKPLRELSTFREDGDGDPSLLRQQTFMADEEEVLKGDGDIFRMYFREVSKVPLLTREREIELARRIQRGQRKIHNLLLSSLASVGKIDRLDPESAKNHGRVVRSREEVVKKAIRRLEERAKHSGGDCNRFRDLLAELKKTEADLRAAKAEMVQSNLRLVVKVAKRYLNSGISFLDLLQEGNLGLMKAVTRFDYRRGYKFSTYASWWIRQAISRAVADKSRTIHIPNHLLEMRGKILRAFHQFVKERGKEPFPEEIASKVGIDPDKVHRVVHLTQEPISLEAPVGERQQTGGFHCERGPSQLHSGSHRAPGSRKKNERSPLPPQSEGGADSAASVRHRRTHAPYVGRGRNALRHITGEGPADPTECGQKTEGPNQSPGNPWRVSGRFYGLTFPFCAAHAEGH